MVSFYSIYVYPVYIYIYIYIYIKVLKSCKKWFCTDEIAHVKQCIRYKLK